MIKIRLRGISNHLSILIHKTMPTRNRTRLKEFKCFFITTTCINWLNLLQPIPERIDILSGEKLPALNYYPLLYDSLNFVNAKYKTHIVAYVFMSNHIHLILYFEDENWLSEYMRDFKKYTSGEIRRAIDKEKLQGLLDLTRYNHRNQKFKIWMDRFDDVIINSRKIMISKLNYIHNNPIRKDLVLYPTEYIHSSAGFYFEERAPLIPILHYMEIT